MGPLPQQLHSINYADITLYQHFSKSVRCLSLLCFFLSCITDVLSSCVQKWSCYQDVWGDKNHGKERRLRSWNLQTCRRLLPGFMIKELCYAVSSPLKAKTCVSINWIPKIMFLFCWLKLYLGIETVSCRLFPRMARMGMDWKTVLMSASWW